MRRFAALFLKTSALSAVGLLFITGCSTIHTVPLPSSNVNLTPNPPIILVSPFRTDHTQWFTGDDRLKDGFEADNFKPAFQTEFTHELTKRLMKLAPTEERWQDDLPDHGWLVTGDFVTVSQGSRALRMLVGAGNGATTLACNVYIYDLDRSKTQYVLGFRTGFPDIDGEGAGSNHAVSGISALPVPGLTPTMSAFALGEGLKLDSVNTCRAIRDQLAQYFNPPIDVEKLH